MTDEEDKGLTLEEIAKRAELSVKFTYRGVTLEVEIDDPAEFDIKGFEDGCAEFCFKAYGSFGFVGH